jgi:hypothetical protein
MLKKALGKIVSPKTRNIALAAGGMGALLVGRKASAVTMFASGIAGLEKIYREENDFEGTWFERYERSIAFYEETHSNETNRWLHIVGIPIIASSTAGLLIFRPLSLPWLASWGGFAAGWTTNFIGHGFFEKNAPAFADDPLSFFIGPVWDIQQALKLGKQEDSVEVTQYSDTVA